MPRKIELNLPVLHSDQRRAYKKFLKARVGLCLRAGRRWGKTDLAKTMACDTAMGDSDEGRDPAPVGWFAPEYKFISEAFNEVVDLLEPVKVTSSKNEGVIRLKGGGRIDFWSLDNERAGRSRKYKLAIIDEAAFTKNGVMLGIWEKSIRPTLFDLGGKALVCSNTNGVDPENFLYAIDPLNDAVDPLKGSSKYGFDGFHAPTGNNTLLPMRLPNEDIVEWELRRAEALQKLVIDNHPDVYRQEYLAEFVDWSGKSFFERDRMLVDGQPVEFPDRCDGVFAIIDCATKTSERNDGTAVTYFIRSRIGYYPLVVADWDIMQIEGATLSAWLPTVFENLEALAKECGARSGSLGVWIEDKSAGEVLLQHAKANKWPARAIDGRITAVGKDGRAISVSGYVYRNQVKMARRAFDKVTTYKGSTRNHFLAQVGGFRVGIDNKDDDLLDTFTSGISMALGDGKGF